MNSLCCEICGQVGHGIHFGVVSCRACAAFFRRTADSKWDKMECLSKNCTEKIYQCKPCRLKRCRAMGMSTDKFQLNRDTQMIPRKRKLPPAFEQFLGRPHVVIFCEKPSESTRIPKTFIDTNYLIQKAQEILKTGCEAPWAGRSHLEKLSYGLHRQEANLKYMPEITRKETSELWEFYLLSTARWLTYFPPFQDLEDSMKLQILLSTWHVWSRLHKLIANALYRNRNKSVKPGERVTGDGLLTDISAPKSDIGWMSRYSKEQVSYFIDGMRGSDLCPIIDCLKDMEFSEVELSFMLAQLCFQYASGRFPGKIGDAMERFQEILSNDLHSYYTENLDKPRYSGRLIRMLKINGDIQENIRKHRDRAKIAKTFEIFNLDFSHPEMFIDTPIN